MCHHDLLRHLSFFLMRGSTSDLEEMLFTLELAI